MEITGKLIQKLPVKSGVSSSGNNWSKAEFVIETVEQYPKKVCANLWGDRARALDQFQEGSLITVSFDLESREFNGNWYTDVKAWKVEAATPAASPSSLCTRLKVTRNNPKVMRSHNSPHILLNRKAIHLHRNKVMHQHNLNSLRHLPSLNPMSIRCPICRRVLSRMREEQMICRSRFKVQGSRFKVQDFGDSFSQVSSQKPIAKSQQPKLYQLS